jgi:hypothetical protein
MGLHQTTQIVIGYKLERVTFNDLVKSLTEEQREQLYDHPLFLDPDPMTGRSPVVFGVLGAQSDFDSETVQTLIVDEKCLPILSEIPEPFRTLFIENNSLLNFYVLNVIS